MAWQPIATTYGYAAGTGTTLDSHDTLNIAVGDILVVSATWESGASTIAFATTVPDNSFTMLAISSNGTDPYHVLGYVKVTVANAAAVIRGTWGTSRAFRSYSIWQWRPDAGYVVSLVAGPSAGHGSSASMVSGAVSPSGSALLVVAGCKSWTGAAPTAQQIGAANADGHFESSQFNSIWYKLYATSQVAITATATHANTEYVIDIMAFNEASPYVYFTGSSAGHSSTSAAIRERVRFSASSICQSATVASIRARVRFLGSCTGHSTTSAAMRVRVRFVGLSNAQSAASATLEEIEGLSGVSNSQSTAVAHIRERVRFTGSSAAVSATSASITYVAQGASVVPVLGAGWPDFLGGAKEEKEREWPIRKKKEKSVVERILDYLSVARMYSASRLRTFARMQVRVPVRCDSRTATSATIRCRARFEGSAHAKVSVSVQLRSRTRFVGGSVAGMCTYSSPMYVHVSREKFEKDLMEILMIDTA